MTPSSDFILCTPDVLASPAEMDAASESNLWAPPRNWRARDEIYFAHGVACPEARYPPTVARGHTIGDNLEEVARRGVEEVCAGLGEILDRVHMSVGRKTHPPPPHISPPSEISDHYVRNSLRTTYRDRPAHRVRQREKDCAGGGRAQCWLTANSVPNHTREECLSSE